METTICHVRLYVIPMPCCVVVSTTPIKALPDFTPREIFPTDFHSTDHDALSVGLLQDFCQSIFVVDHDWNYTKTGTEAIDIIHQIPPATLCQVDNSIDNSDNIMRIRIKMSGHTSSRQIPYIFYQTENKIK